jgi:hypothetical protein
MVVEKAATIFLARNRESIRKNEFDRRLATIFGFYTRSIE